ncbi:MAG: GNAT family N-acetyltransferase [Erysipelotrichaceae bacterium]|nr:GNAT family N-acetyltransferase [Erysipelotrichaceae bacterium]
MDILKAKHTDFITLEDISGEIFESEQGIPKSLTHIDDDNNPQWWYVLDDKIIVGTICAYFEDNKCHMGRIAIIPSMRNKGIATKMIRQALEDLFLQGVDTIYLEARDVTVHMLEKMGGKVNGEPFEFYGDICTPVVINKRNYIEK